ncbi:MAG: 3'-5' exonuclease, partial [Pseudomonadota bacterium]
LANIVAKLNGSLAQRLNTLTRLNSDTAAAEVVLSTLHGSKGLEFDNVWIIAAEDGNLPHPDSTEAEERRLFYVGMTRSRNRLEISSSLEDGQESRFMMEAELL